MMYRIVMISAYDYVEIEEEARAAGVDGFLQNHCIVPQSMRKSQESLKERKADRYRERKNKLLSGKKMLLAEDNDMNREIAKELLRLQGATVIACEDGKKALEEFQRSGIQRI